MVKLTVLYGHPTDSAAFDKHYAEVHTPLVHKLPGLARFEAAKVVGSPTGEQPDYYLIAELYFENMEQFQASMGSAEGRATGRDVPNFASGGATMFISELS